MTLPPQDFQDALADRYRFERVLGQGGMATVWLARDLKHDRQVAVKTLRPELAAHLGSARFLREIQIAARLNHPHILSLHDSGEAAGRIYYVMPFVEGETLRDLLDRQERVPLELALRYTREVADALAYAHGQGIIHRDIKPENILIQSGHAVVSDFGIARAVSAAGGTGGSSTLTAAGAAIGTPLYMSPEQILGEPLDFRSDLYSLGCVLYELLSGAPPFTGAGPRALIAAHTAQPVPPLRDRRPDIPPAVETATLRALAKLPGDRFGSAEEFAGALAPGAITPRPAPGRSWRRLAAAALVVIALGGAWLLLHRPRPDGTVAVLPFSNQSSNPDDQYFADGMTDELINALGRMPGLRVQSRTSVNALGNAALTPEEIGTRLKVGALVEGSLQRDGSGQRIHVQLISARDGSVIWSESYQRDQGQVFAVQDQIVRALATALAVRGAPAAGLVARTTENTAAYDQYLKGRYYWSQRAAGTAPLQAAAAHFDTAIALDSGYARAWAGLADVYSMMPAFGDVPPTEAFTRARLAAERALALDSTLAEAHTSLGFVELFYDWAWERAGQEFDRAQALDSTEARTWLFRAWYDMAMARYDEALVDIRTAHRLNPEGAIINARVGTTLMYVRRYDEAAEYLQKVLAADSTNATARGEMVRVMMMQGRREEAARLATRLDPGLQAGYLGEGLKAYAYGLAGWRDSAAAAERRLAGMARSRYVTPSAFAYAALGRGDTATALDWMERGYREKAFYMLMSWADPLMDPHHDSPRFRRIMADMHLVEPPKARGDSIRLGT
jgi:serine/threonine-protein kinase